MSVVTEQLLTSIVRQLSLYYQIPVCSLGVVGAVLNIIVFLSLNTFRRSSCAFYLTIMSVCDLAHLLFVELPGVLTMGFGMNLTLRSLVWCKLQVSIRVLSSLSSSTCLCLAALDQYFATCYRPRWQQWCNTRLAHRLVIIFILLWCGQAVPYYIFYDHVLETFTNRVTCTITNSRFVAYHSYGYFLCLWNIIPLTTAVFGLMAFYNARHLAHRTIPLVRRELDKQLTVMVLVQVLLSFWTFLPYSVQSMFALTLTSNDTDYRLKVRLAGRVTFFFSLLSIMVRSHRRARPIFSLGLFLEPILHVCLRVQTFSSATRSRSVTDLLPTMPIHSGGS